MLAKLTSGFAWQSVSSYMHLTRRYPISIWRGSVLPRLKLQRAQYSWKRKSADELQSKGPEASATLAIKSKSRFSEINIQHISEHLHSQLFPCPGPNSPSELVALAKKHLQIHDLFGKTNDNADPIAFEIPPLQGKTKTLDEHFHRLGIDCAQPFLDKAIQFSSSRVPPRPKKWVCQSGWTKYTLSPSGEFVAKKVQAPEDDMLSFDVETLWKQSPFAVMACAVSPTAWYAWISPWLLRETENDRHLVPLGDPTIPRIVVGHNIGYDRARILEEYSLAQSQNAFIDTMSLHVAVNGMCSQQRPTWMKHQKNRQLREKMLGENSTIATKEALTITASKEEEELWVERSSINSLRDVAKFHLDQDIDKTIRDDFGDLNRQDIVTDLDRFLTYCAADVETTHNVFKVVFKNFLRVCPHPVSFAALRHLSNVILPINETWEQYIVNSEETYKRLSDGVQDRLVSLTRNALELKDHPEKWMNDPWLKQLDWSVQEIRMVKGKGGSPRPAANQKMPGMPKWYRDLFPKATGPMNISVRTRVAALLLRLSWDGYPLFWSEKYGWTFRVPRSDATKYMTRQMILCDMTEEKIKILRDNRNFVYFKLPHKDGPNARCANPLAKSYLAYFESGTLSSEYSYAKEALEMNASCSYWISARDRIRSQMVVYENDLSKRKSSGNKQGYILPQVIPMGTITRRAVENTWLTASNAKSNRVGSELKAMVKAPPGYVFVGADVDSEELWVASLLGDATFQLHGGNAIGFMTLEGTKAAGTDMHSRTASILGITRNDAKIFNYGRIYGAGLKFAATLLRQFNHSLSENETMEIATKLYASTKGAKTTRRAFSPRSFWRGGTESFVFNKLEEFAEQDQPRTPVLGAGITEALMGRFVNKGGFLTSRINWAVQSSGVDYLHLLIVAMDYLTRRYNIDARLAITVHDEIRYLVKEKDKYRAAMALQVSNLWTRAMFSEQVGISDLPQSCAFFSAIDIDNVLRKEVDLDCVTPSHPTPIPPGESLNITQLLDKGQKAYLDSSVEPTSKSAPRLDGIQYTPRIPVMKTLDGNIDNTSLASLNFIEAQITSSDEDLKRLLKVQKKLVGPLKPVTRKSEKPGKNQKSTHLASLDLIRRQMKQPLVISDLVKQDNMKKSLRKFQASGFSVEQKPSSSTKCYSSKEPDCTSSLWAPSDNS